VKTILLLSQFFCRAYKKRGGNIPHYCDTFIPDYPDDRAQVLLALQHDPANAFSGMHDHAPGMHIKAIDDTCNKIKQAWQAYLKDIQSIRK
jgi:hypothetical protein